MITEFIIKYFIKDYKNINDSQVRAQYGILEGWLSIVLNIFLFVIKLGAGVLVNSISLKVDAIHTLSDIGSSIAVIWGFKISGRPPDKEHPFGHQRMEYVTTLIIAVLLMVAGLEFFKASIERIWNPAPVLFHPWIIFLVFLTMIVKEWMAVFARDIGQRIDSKSLYGDFLHHRTDAITTLIVLVALFSSKIGLPILDALIGVSVSVFIIYAGWKMISETITPLLGESATYDELLKIKSIAMSGKGILGVHDIMMHKYGNIKIISLHAEIPEDIPFIDAHNIIEDLEEKINIQMNATTVIHLDPMQKMTEELKAVHSRLDEIVRSNKLIKSYHDVRIIKANGATNLIMDVVASGDRSSDKQMLKSREQITSLLKSCFPDCTIKVWIEPQYNMTI